jgi:Archaeal glycosylation protein B long peripheral domain
VGQAPEHYYGWLAWLVPLAPLGPLLAARDPARRAAALVLAAWTAVLGSLAVWQARYGSDFSPAGSIAFALLLEAATRPLARPGWPRALRPAAAVLAWVALLWQPLVYYAPGVGRSAAAVFGWRPPEEEVLASPSGTLHRFMLMVRQATPETSGFLGPGRPEYGVLCRPRIGHALHYLARRAAPADGFLYTLGPENFAAALRFFRVPSEAEAVQIAERLGIRYVVTMFFPGMLPGSVEARLQVEGGAGDADGEGRLEHFRLITEGPADGSPLSDLFGFPRPEHVVPYRLFERVEGAVLVAHAPPGTPISARLWLVSPLGRRFAYRARGEAGADGAARLRVPYATDRTSPTVAHGIWRVQVGVRVAAVAVSDTAVREGREIAVEAPDAEPAQKASKSSASKRTRAASTRRPVPERSPNIRISGTGRSRRGRSM